MKQDLLEILKNPNDKLICVDLDGTLCNGIYWGEESEITPNQPMIDLVWKLYKNGAHIIISTARNVIHTAATYAWLDKHCIPYHGLMMNRKPGADLYLDDLALCVDENFLKQYADNNA